MNFYNKAMIFGVTGQDGSYLAELLLDKGYTVFGVVRRTSGDNTQRIAHLKEIPSFITLWGDLTDSHAIYSLIEKIRPSEVYNLAAQSDVGLSFQMPEMTADSTGLGVLRILEAIKRISPETRYYQASTSELFGKTVQFPQNEQTVFYPRSPYGIAKLYGYWITRMFREGYGVHASNGILFNHESERRGDNFVTQKIVKGMVNIVKRNQSVLYLGNLDAKRDWGYAKDYVKAMWQMVQHDVADDYVVATGVQRTVREFVNEVAGNLDVGLIWEGVGVNETAKNAKTGEIVVAVDPNFYRPAEVESLCGDYSKINKTLGWVPETSFEEMVKIMVQYQLENSHA